MKYKMKNLFIFLSVLGFNFAIAQGPTQKLPQNIYNALIANPSSPSTSNPFATFADLSGGGGGTDTSKIPLNGTAATHPLRNTIVFKPPYAGATVIGDSLSNDMYLGWAGNTLSALTSTVGCGIDLNPNGSVTMKSINTSTGNTGVLNFSTNEILYYVQSGSHTGSFKMYPDSFIVSGKASNFVGAEYDRDYSANYKKHSLVDSAYVGAKLAGKQNTLTDVTDWSNNLNYNYLDFNTPPTILASYQKVGNKVTVITTFGSNANTSASTSFRITNLPYMSKAQYLQFNSCNYYIDNGAAHPSGSIQLTSNSNILTMYTLGASNTFGSWTSSGQKGCIFNFTYFTQPRNRLLYEGNSYLNLVHSFQQNCDSILLTLGDTLCTNNYAISGSTIGNIIGAPYMLLPQRINTDNAFYDGTQGKNICAWFEFLNNNERMAAAGATKMQIVDSCYNQFLRYTRQKVSLGYKVVFSSATNFGGFGATQDTLSEHARQNYANKADTSTINGKLRALYPNNISGNIYTSNDPTLVGSYMTDMGNDIHYGQAGNCANTTYYNPDKIHETTLGKVYISSNYYAPAIHYVNTH